MTGDGREWLAAQPLPATAREQVTVALAMIDGIETQIAPIDKELRAYAHRQAGCKALMAHYGIGPLVAVTILAELGDCTRFSSSRLAVRYAGMDITVYQSDQRRAPGHLSRQGPPALRWALFEAAQVARRHGSPDREYYEQAAQRLGGNRACLAVKCGQARPVDSPVRNCAEPGHGHQPVPLPLLADCGGHLDHGHSRCAKII